MRTTQEISTRIAMCAAGSLWLLCLAVSGSAQEPTTSDPLRPGGESHRLGPIETPDPPSPSDSPATTVPPGPLGPLDLPELPKRATPILALTRALDTISGDRMLKDVTHLSGPGFRGRQTGTPDDLRSGLYVAEQFRALGLHPAGIQPLAPLLQAAGTPPATIPEAHQSEHWVLADQAIATRISEGPVLELLAQARMMVAKVGVDYLPILDSPSVDVIAPVVFVGYGLVDSKLGINDYEGMDVNKKVVLFLRGKPEHHQEPFRHADKVRIAREQGAIGYLTATGPVLSAYEARRGLGPNPMAYYGNHAGDPPFPGAWVSTEFAEQILAPGFAKWGATLQAIQAQLNRAPILRSMDTKTLVRLSWKSHEQPGLMANIQGAIVGKDPLLREETILLGAHRDHFGDQAGLIFHGADDNASGTAVLLEVARAFIAAGVQTKRTIVFASFSGEEQNLLGSRLYIKRPARPLTSTVAMINVDHAGVGNGNLTIGLAGLPKTTAQEAGEFAGLAGKLDLFGFFPGGDHVPFSQAGVPTVAIVSSGRHPHFHQASDRADTVDPAILETAARFVLALAWRLANDP
ncbi:MAG: M20/M25/M40 family metallo-hydrolase [Nitrospirales bacterium]